MTKLLTLIALLFTLSVVSNQAKAQFGNAALMPLVAGDTLVNSDTQNKIFTATAGYNAVTLQPIFTRLTGTGTGTVTLYGSLDGTNYKAIGSNAFNISASPTTVTTDIWPLSLASYVYYKTAVVSTGTVTGIIRIYYLLRKDISQ